MFRFSIGIDVGRVRHWVFFGLISVLLAACGGGGGGGANGTPSASVACDPVCNSWGIADPTFFTGSRGGGNAGDGGSGADGGAGDGAPIRLALVTITDSTSPVPQVASATTDINGYYKADVTGFKPPLIASITYTITPATGAPFTVTRYSASVTPLKKNGFITMNITGLTTYLASRVAIAAGGSGASDLTPAMLSDPSSTLTSDISFLRNFLATNLTPALKTEIAGYGLDLSTFDPISSRYIPQTISGYDTILENVSATTPTSTATNLALKTPLELAKAFFAELRTTWGTSISPAANSINDFLYSQTTQTTADVNSVVQPNLTKLQGRLEALSRSMNLVDDAQTYVAVTNTHGLVSGAVPFGGAGTAPGTGLIESFGLVSDAWNGIGSYVYCWTDSPTGLTTYARCFHAGSGSAATAPNRLKGILVEITSTGTGQYSYTAKRFDWNVNAGGTAVTGTPAQKLTDSATPTPNNIPTGSGTVTRTFSGTTITNLQVNGSFPPTATLNDAGQVLTGGVDTLVVNSVRTALSTANNYHYTLQGSISTPSLADPTQVVALSFDSGSYFDSDDTNAATTGKQLLIAKIIGTLKTKATQMTGTFDLTAPSVDGDGLNRQFTKLVFDGNISNLAGANVGKFLTGKLNLNLTNYASFHSLQVVSNSNYQQGNSTFTGTLQAPLRPLMTLTFGLTKTGATTSDATMQYKYGLDVQVDGTTSTDSSTGAKAILSLVNQNGVKIVLDTTAYTGPVTVPLSGTTVWGNIAGGVVNYSDGSTESFN